MKEILAKVKEAFPEYEVFVENNVLVVEEYWESNGCKNDDDCSDNAQDIGEKIVNNFPQLEVFDYYCHRHKYSIVELKLTNGGL